MVLRSHAIFPMSSYYNHSAIKLYILQPQFVLVDHRTCYKVLGSHATYSEVHVLLINITVKMLIMTKVGQKIVRYIREAYFDSYFYINSQLSDTMESTIIDGDSQCKYLWRYSNEFADAKIYEHYS